MIIGLTGKNASGKGEVGRFLQERGFVFLSLSDELRSELGRQRLAVTRDNLTRIGNRLRKTDGPSVLADRMLLHIDDTTNYVVDSFRNPSEVQAFRRMKKDFELWSIESSARLRFARIKARARESDPMTLANFVKVEKREAKNVDPTKQSLDDCAHLSNRHISNNSTLDALHKRITAAIQDRLKHTPRPSWDTYFMNIAQVVASRSNCMKRKVAAVIVKEGRIISTGYNGTPRGVKNCNEGGCPRCNSFGPSGKGLSDCFCSHGEENAIVQASYHGISIKNSSLYSTFSPCLLCTKMIINGGISEVVYNQAYPLGETALSLLKKAGVSTRKITL